MTNQVITIFQPQKSFSNFHILLEKFRNLANFDFIILSIKKISLDNSLKHQGHLAFYNNFFTLYY